VPGPRLGAGAHLCITPSVRPEAWRSGRRQTLSPIATEMPETLIAIIWVRQGRERMALANISGAMMIQATVPTACGVFGTPWLFDRPLVLAGGVTALAIVMLFLMFRGQVTGKRLSWSSLLYLLFAGTLLLR
jgi:cation:H+ antiporter